MAGGNAVNLTIEGRVARVTLNREESLWKKKISAGRTTSRHVAPSKKLS